MSDDLDTPLACYVVNDAPPCLLLLKLTSPCAPSLLQDGPLLGNLSPVRRGHRIAPDREPGGAHPLPRPRGALSAAAAEGAIQAYEQADDDERNFIKLDISLKDR